MSNKKSCEVENCNGFYETKTLYYINFHKRRTDQYKVSIEDYNKLEDTKGHVAVISDNCDICNDSLDDRLVSFIRKNF